MRTKGRPSCAENNQNSALSSERRRPLKRLPQIAGGIAECARPAPADDSCESGTFEMCLYWTILHAHDNQRKGQSYREPSLKDHPSGRSDRAFGKALTFEKDLIYAVVEWIDTFMQL
ncbi:hypothetical protein EVAR_81953_1 [Eumeta japonica]|uniref:Uncharacterized protein n=1 Tax=Eumeta variegata TaxID=151549 RepID=A0A4C1ZHQ3_EUMVA|nr:hypothetical protein EVAR_81953_1 [Eumeta japonica]